MRLTFESFSADELRLIDFGEPSFGIRNADLRCLISELPTLGWTVFNVFAPMRHGLFLIRTYEAFDASLRSYFQIRHEGKVDEARMNQFRTALRKIRIPEKSDGSYRCFGLFPRLFGTKFAPASLRALPVNRLLSIAVPSADTDAVRAHLSEQFQVFGERVIIAVDEDEVLIPASPHAATDAGRLLLAPVAGMTGDERRAAVSRLELLVQDRAARSAFESTIPFPLKIAGAIRTPDVRDVVEGHAAECWTLAWLRVRLICELDWPHAAERIRTSLDASGASIPPEIALRLNQACGLYPVIEKDPLAAVAR